jgi:hypothetical protein
MADLGGSLTSLMNILGPILLLAALIYGTVRYRRSRIQKAAGDQKTRDLYQAGICRSGLRGRQFDIGRAGSERASAAVSLSRGAAVPVSGDGCPGRAT